MPRKTGLVERRRLALISAMAEKKLSSKALADLIGGTEEEKRKRHWKVQSFRRTKKTRLLKLEDAQLFATHLGVPVARLLAGELTAEERTASGGDVLAEVASEAQSSQAAALEDRKQLGKERRKALKKAVGKKSARQLQRELAAAGKQWTIHQVTAYLGGAAFANRDFLTDVAEVLGKTAPDLWIRESSLEDLGRRKLRVTGPPEPAAASPPPEVPVPGIAVSVVSEALGVSLTDNVVYVPRGRRFAGTASEVVQDGNGFRLVVSVPLGDTATRALLGLVTG